MPIVPQNLLDFHDTIHQILDRVVRILIVRELLWTEARMLDHVCQIDKQEDVGIVLVGSVEEFHSELAQQLIQTSHAANLGAIGEPSWDVGTRRQQIAQMQRSALCLQRLVL